MLQAPPNLLNRTEQVEVKQEKAKGKKKQARVRGKRLSASIKVEIAQDSF